ncbi:hypothetical protein [Streptomyces sp. NRRL B-24484]|uniref:hypothetical protein n=1 Tax=Streptomyces sp. NRRL B-24484 TaxID=1463833 RepID=UPI0004C081A3|nr:hypothetical protein [Streptomyces sp. NRRL B-24484]
MSLHRENVTWESADGTWTIGFYDFVETGGDDRDEEWDVEYLNTFGWVSAGHPTSEAAMAAYTAHSANPGGTTLVRWCEENAAEITQLNELAAQHASGPGNPHWW